MKPNIKICVPCYCESIYNNSIAKHSITKLTKDHFNFEVFTGVGARPLSTKRNQLINDGKSQEIRQKLDNRFSHILNLDHDIGFTEDHILQLLKHDKDIVSGCYVSKANEKIFETWILDDQGVNQEYAGKDSKGLHKINGGCGLGFLLCKREAIEGMTYPWFSEFVIQKDGRAEVGAVDAFFA